MKPIYKILLTVITCIFLFILFINATPYIQYMYNVRPSTNNTYDLGSTSYHWDSLFVNNVHMHNINIGRLINQDLWSGDTILCSDTASFKDMYVETCSIGTLKHTFAPSGLVGNVDSVFTLTASYGTAGYDTIKIYSVPIDTVNTTYSLDCPVANYNAGHLGWINDSTLAFGCANFASKKWHMVVFLHKI